jgi:hypothetical protein
MDLEQLLIENYDGRTASFGETKRQVRAFLNENGTVLGEHPGFVKRLTKVADNILAENPGFFNGYLERLYIYNLEGAEIIMARTVEMQARYAWLMKSHFYLHASKIAELIFNKTNDQYWAENWFHTSRKAAVHAHEIDMPTVIISYKKAGSAAYTLFRISKDMRWIEDAIRAHSKAIEARKTYQGHIKAGSLGTLTGLLGHSYYSLYIETEAKEDLDIAYTHACNAIPQYEPHELDRKMLSTRIKGLIEFEYFKRTFDEAWKQKATASLTAFKQYFGNKKWHPFYRHMHATNNVLDELEKYRWNFKKSKAV